MADTYTTPVNVVADEVLTATRLNQQLFANIRHLRDDMPSAQVYNSANISIPNATDTALTFDTEEWDTDTIHSTVSNTSRLTATTAGRYLVWFMVEWAANVNAKTLKIRHGGTTVRALLELTPTSGGAVFRMMGIAFVNLAAGEYIELMARQDSGGAININAVASLSPYFGMVKV